MVGRAALLRPEWGQAGSLPSLGKLAVFPKALGWLQPWDSEEHKEGGRLL